MRPCRQLPHPPDQEVKGRCCQIKHHEQQGGHASQINATVILRCGFLPPAGLLDPEKGSPETKDTPPAASTDRSQLLSLFLMNCCCLFWVHIRHVCVFSTVVLYEQTSYRKRKARICSYSATATLKGEKMTENGLLWETQSWRQRPDWD